MSEPYGTDTADRLLRTQEVARWLAVSKSTLVRWRQSLEGPQVFWLADGVPH
jgi:predicted DNA-binding transcriptional regulator AlpA